MANGGFRVLEKNEIIELKIEAMSHEGDGIGRFDGMALFVPMAAVGDSMKVKVVKVLKNHAYARVEQIVEPSGHRIANDCPYYKRCGGCSMRHINYSHETEIKSNWVEENLRRIGKTDIKLDGILPSPKIERYRNKAQYPVRKIDGRICAGFFAKRSHELIAVDDCLLQPVFFRDIVDTVIAFMEDFSLEAYDESANSGLLRHIFIRYAEASQQAMLCLVINSDKLPHVDELVKRLNATCAEVKTVAVNVNKDRTNVIFGARTHTVYGSGKIVDELCGVKASLSAQSFYQVNRESAQQLYNAALEYAQPDSGDILLDLYCGAGTIGLSMAHAVKQVIGVEIVGAAIADAKENARQNGIANARFICADAAEAAAKLKTEGIRPDIVVLDPPRKGADEKLPDIISELAPKKLIYISCNSATLARDAAKLREVGFEIKKARAVDLFPRTAHVECVALMTRKKT